MGIEAAIAFQVVTGVVSGIAAEKAGKAQQKQFEQQAKVVRAEAKRDAGRLRLRHKQAIARKKLQFFKQGVAIPGSPANIIASDINLQDEEARAIIARGNAQSSLLITQGQIAKSEGRAALLSSIMGGISSGIMTGVLAGSLKTEDLDVLGTSTQQIGTPNITPRLGDINITPRGFNNNFNKIIV